MSILDSILFKGQDTRVKKYLLPQRILQTEGNVRDVDNLLVIKPFQIGFDWDLRTELINESGKPKASILLDFGLEFHGGIRLLTALCKSKSKTIQIRLTFGESVSEAMSSLGERGSCNDHSPRDIKATISSMSDLEFAQTGYRFVRLQLLTPNAEWLLRSTVGTFVYHDIPYIGSFCCSNEQLNRIYDTAVYTCHLNIQNLIWDGIKRDRLVWIGDTHPEMLTIRSVFGRVEILEEGLRFAREEAPLPKWMNTMPTYSLWWIRILYEWYFSTGGLSFLEENREYAMALGRQIASYIQDDGDHSLPDYFLDWPTKNTEGAKPGVHGLLVSVMDALTALAEIYHDSEGQILFAEKAHALRKICPDAHGYKQAIAMQAMAGLLDQEKAALALADKGSEGVSAFMSYYILTAMAEGGHMTEALNILLKYYGGMLQMGATTFWEDFDLTWMENAVPITEFVPEGKSDIHGDNGAFCYKGFRHSLCHGWSSGPVPFLAEQVLGIRILAPGCRKLGIFPSLGDLDWAKGSYPTPYGAVSISHTKNLDGSIHTEYTAPKEIELVFQ